MLLLRSKLNATRNNGARSVDAHVIMVDDDLELSFTVIRGLNSVSLRRSSPARGSPLLGVPRHAKTSTQTLEQGERFPFSSVQSPYVIELRSSIRRRLARYTHARRTLLHSVEYFITPPILLLYCWMSHVCPYNGYVGCTSPAVVRQLRDTTQTLVAPVAHGPPVF